MEKLVPLQENLYDQLKKEAKMETAENYIRIRLDTDLIKKEKAKLKFYIKEFDDDMFHVGNCEFEEIIKGGNGVQLFKYPFREKCTGYERVDRLQEFTDRKMKVEILMDGRPFMETSFDLLLH